MSDLVELGKTPPVPIQRLPLKISFFAITFNSSIMASKSNCFVFCRSMESFASAPNRFLYIEVLEYLISLRLEKLLSDVDSPAGSEILGRQLWHRENYSMHGNQSVKTWSRPHNVGSQSVTIYEPQEHNRVLQHLTEKFRSSVIPQTKSLKILFRLWRQQWMYRAYKKTK